MQILGAEKALFRALKTKHDTPKYGLIYHASLVGQSNAKNKGKVGKMILFSGGGGGAFVIYCSNNVLVCIKQLCILKMLSRFISIYEKSKSEQCEIFSY